MDYVYTRHQILVVFFQVQHEHKVVRQSAFSEGVAYRKDNCLGRKDNSSFRPKSAPDGKYLHSDILILKHFEKKIY